MRGPPKRLQRFWFKEDQPRYARIDRFEWGTGFYINSTTPEKAAESLKKVKI